jgi:hypothetical protein
MKKCADVISELEVRDPVAIETIYVMAGLVPAIHVFLGRCR